MWKIKQIFSGLALAMLAMIALGGTVQGEAAEDGSFTGEVIQVAEQIIATGDVGLLISLELPAGYEVMRDAPILAKVTSSDKQVIALGEEAGATCKQPKFPLRVPLKASAGATRLQVDLVLYYCKQGAGGLCITKQARFVLPVKVDEAARNKELQVSYKLPAI